MHARVDVVVIGGGVVGLACARELGRRGKSVLLVERGPRLASETSARNSGVVHAGLHHPASWTKTSACIRGRTLLLEYAKRAGVPHEETGKLVVACDADDERRLDELERNARDRGVPVRALDARELRAAEPALRGTAALHSPNSGIVDAHALCDALARDARGAGVVTMVETEFLEGARAGGSFRVALRRRDERETVACDAVVNAAGLHADVVSERMGIDVARDALGIHPNKGCYFRLEPDAPRPTAKLVYPLPAGQGLGIHLTTDLSGARRLGPDSEWVDALDYDVDASRLAAFAAAARRYLPGLSDAHLTPDFAGIRPKLRAASGGAARDFVVEECSRHGVPGLVQLVGIESPGLTASLALAELVAREVERMT